MIELKRDAIAEIVLNHLYRNTQMQTTFGIIFLAIANNKPEVMDLPDDPAATSSSTAKRSSSAAPASTCGRPKSAPTCWRAWSGRSTSSTRSSPSSAPAGLPGEAKEGLISSWQFSEIQAQAILEMRLQRLTGLEREKLVEEYQEVLALIARLQEILASEKLILDIIANELRDVKEHYGDPRRTEIIPDTNEISIEDLVADEDMVITVSRGGYIKRSPLSIYRSQRRGGKGRIGMQTKEEDIVEHLFVASTHAYVLVFTDRGRLYWLKVHTIPEVAANARGKAIVNLLPVEQNENVRALLTTRDFTEGKYVVMSTRGGKIKKTELSAFSNVRATGIIAIDILEGDDLHSVAFSDGDSEIFIGTADGRAVRFHESEVRPMGRGAAGVKGITLRDGDHVVEMDVLPDRAQPRPTARATSIRRRRRWKRRRRDAQEETRLDDQDSESTPRPSRKPSWPATTADTS